MWQKIRSVTQPQKTHESRTRELQIQMVGKRIRKDNIFEIIKFLNWIRFSKNFMFPENISKFIKFFLLLTSLLLSISDKFSNYLFWRFLKFLKVPNLPKNLKNQRKFQNFWRENNVNCQKNKHFTRIFAIEIDLQSKIVALNRYNHVCLFQKLKKSSFISFSLYSETCSQIYLSMAGLKHHVLLKHEGAKLRCHVCLLETFNNVQT
jgi:hypothetical protein